VDLNRVDWGAATRELTGELGGGDTPRMRRQRAALASLRARFTDDHAVAAAAVAGAVGLEPLDPVHRVRGILMKARFGDLAGALADLEALPEAVADLPHVLVIKALVTLRRGEPATARNIADRAIQIDPGCTAARFLHVEAQLATQRKGGLDKLVELPRGAALEPAWADLLAKLAILRPGDHRAVAAQLERGAIARGGRADAVVRSVVAWASPATGADELARIAEAQAGGSRAEALAIALLASRLAAGDPTAACTALHQLAGRHGDRPAMRRALVAALTQLAVTEAGATRLAPALRIVQACLDLEPHEPVHQQNLAALFTLSGEHDAAFDAWAALDRLHYRLALLGRLDPASAARYAAPHRMFALAARLTPGAARAGVFVAEREEDGDLELAVNQDAIDRDPEQLRQWLHHGRASLGFELIALGMTRDRLLLAPASPDQATERAEGLAQLVQSLAVLVPDEGRRLADCLAKRFRALGEGAPQRYRPAELDAAAQIVQRHAIELYAEIALLCLAWSPDPARRGLVDEVIETVRAVAPLFDEDALARLIKDAAPSAHRAPSALPRLRGRMLSVLRIAPEDRERAFDPRQLRRFAGALAGRLRVQRVSRRLDDAEPAECEQLADELDAARKDDPDSPYTEYIAAFVLARGSFFDDARRAVAAFHRLAKGDHPLLDSLGKLQGQIEKARKEGRSKARSRAHAAPQAAAAQADEARDVTAHEAALEDQPTSIPLYVELCHELALAGRWREAHAWADRATARCLASASQLHARELALELLGLEELAARDKCAVASYIAGARTAPLTVLEAVATGGVGLEYVRGLCLLAADRRAEARAAFAAALEACTRGLYLAVLRPLAADVEHAVLAAARQDIDAACRDRRYGDAQAIVVERMAAAAAPAPYVLELARVQFAAAIAAIGTSAPPLVAPEIAIEASWRGELAAALAAPEPVARIRALVELGRRLSPAGERAAAALVRKLDDLAQQLAAVAVLERADAQVAAGDLEGALIVLDEAGGASGQHARILRQRAIVLLQLERYEAADRAIGELDALADPVAHEFVARYPRLRLRRQIAAATELIRTRELDRARAVLEAATADDPEQEVELVYARACCAAAEGYRCDEAGDRRGALPLLFEALRWAESCLEHARALGHRRLLALHATLERDVAALEEAAS